MKCFTQRFCTMPLDDFDSPPSKESREQMRLRLIESFTKNLDDLIASGLHILGFQMGFKEEESTKEDDF